MRRTGRRCAARSTEPRSSYHLVHSLGSADFEARDRAAARAVADGAEQAGARQIVYLGGLGEGSELSPHLRSRAETAADPRGGSVPVTTLGRR